MEGRTTVVIAHRLSTIRDADQIVVLDNGHAVEQGSHHDLLGRQGLYSQLVSSQLVGAAAGTEHGGHHDGGHENREDHHGEQHDGHHENRELFLVHCPMAFNNEGADWLQTDDVINNPYFGSQMLDCGSIQDVYGSGLPAEAGR